MIMLQKHIYILRDEHKSFSSFITTHDIYLLMNSKSEIVYELEDISGNYIYNFYIPSAM